MKFVIEESATAKEIGIVGICECGHRMAIDLPKDPGQLIGANAESRAYPIVSDYLDRIKAGLAEHEKDTTHFPQENE